MSSHLPRIRIARDWVCQRCTGIAASTSSSSGRTFSTASQRLATYRRFGEPASRPPTTPHNNATNGIPIQQLIQLARSAGGGRGPGGGGRPKKGTRSTTILGGALGLGGAYYVFHLEKVPSTGRWRFIDVSNRQEKQMGDESFQQVLQENRGQLLPSNDKRVKFVHSVAERIVAAAQQSDHPSDHLELGAAGGGLKSGGDTHRPTADGSVQWEVFVIKSDEKNAFVLPNGKIFVYSGILPVCQDQDGLATVLGHEVRRCLLVTPLLRRFHVVDRLSCLLFRRLPIRSPVM
jgi:hypothetical protein